MLRTARYRFRDASGSESVTSVKLSQNATDNAVLGLASLLDQASDASLISVDVLARFRVRDATTSVLPEKYRVAMHPFEPLFDGYHALIPSRSEAALSDVIQEITQGIGWCTRSGYPLEGANRIYYATVNPNWRNYNPPYSPEDKRLLVIHGRLWRDLLITSMNLYSETMRDPLGASSPPNGYARYQLIELVRSVPLDELLQRMDAIIQLLQQIRDSQQIEQQDIDNIEAILLQVIGAIRG